MGAIRDYCQSRGITRTQLAEAIGVSPMTLYRWDHGVASPQIRHHDSIRAATGGALTAGMIIDSSRPGPRAAAE